MFRILAREVHITCEANITHEVHITFRLRNTSLKKALAFASAFFWLPRGRDIRKDTRSFKLGKGDCLGSLIVIECDDHLVIIEKDSVDKRVNKPTSVFQFANVKGSEMLQPANDLILGKGWFGKLLFGDLNIEFRFSRFKRIHTLLGGFVKDPHLYGIDEILDPLFYLGKLFAQTR